MKRSHWDAADWAMFALFVGFAVAVACVGIAFMLDVGFKIGGCG